MLVPLNNSLKLLLLRQNPSQQLFYMRCCSTLATVHQTVRHLCNETHVHAPERPVRVRFAPSPTGYLHLGGLRTALVNYLFAKSKNGTFIVRIEDTDRSRVVPDAQQNFFRNLEWAGIVPDESVVHGGNFGPYVQSQRLEIYRQQVRKLLENGSAYYCFCTETRLETLRREAIEANEIPKYDNRCRHLTPVQVAEKLANNTPMCIRFKLESETVPQFTDLVFGERSIDVSDEGDPVIIKSDGFPTYHFANIVDDHLMEVTHVLRGAEWLISTPKHLLLYEAFGWKPPTYGHLPLILNPDGTKLSKRHDHASVDYYRERKIFPLALINYITYSGGGFAREPGAKIKNFTMKELIENLNHIWNCDSQPESPQPKLILVQASATVEVRYSGWTVSAVVCSELKLLIFFLSIYGVQLQFQFEIRRVHNNSTKLKLDILDECNRLELIRHIEDPKLCDEIVKQVQELIKRTYPKHIDSLDLDDQHIRNVLNWTVSTERLQSLQQLVEGELSFLWILPKIQDDNINQDWVTKLVAALETGDFDKTHLTELLREFSKENNLKFPKFMASLRTMLAGIKEGPGVADMMEILGKKTTIQRILQKKRADKTK